MEVVRRPAEETGTKGGIEHAGNPVISDSGVIAGSDAGDTIAGGVPFGPAAVASRQH